MAVDQKLTRVFLTIRSSLARAVMGIVPPREIEDVVQETYVRVCQSHQKTAIKSPRSFMFRTARNIALNHVKQADTRLVRSFDEAESIGESSVVGIAVDTLDQVCTDEEFSQFCDAVRQLPVQCRRAFVLRKVYGHSQREIASKLNISEKTVETHITKGMKRCRNFMLEQQSEHRDTAGTSGVRGEGA